ncbi:STAS domain-containing protein [Streptomyces sp. NPDC091267]|uniref:STAS domain-containing protein n=1 Tax=unclassified Streptomyces TaxID=2593676 RepID=UPI00341B686A
MMSHESSVVAETIAGALLVRVRGVQDGDSEDLPLLREILKRAAQSDEADRTVLDLSATGFVDSTFLHVLLNVRPAYEKAGKTLVLAGPLPTQVRRLFEVTGTMGAFTHAETVDAAVQGE